MKSVSLFTTIFTYKQNIGVGDKGIVKHIFSKCLITVTPPRNIKKDFNNLAAIDFTFRFDSCVKFILTTLKPFGVNNLRVAILQSSLCKVSFNNT